MALISPVCAANAFPIGSPVSRSTINTLPSAYAHHRPRPGRADVPCTRRSACTGASVLGVGVGGGGRGWALLGGRWKGVQGSSCSLMKGGGAGGGGRFKLQLDWLGKVRGFGERMEGYIEV